jgi:hypothetical protein
VVPRVGEDVGVGFDGGGHGVAAKGFLKRSWVNCRVRSVVAQVWWRFGSPRTKRLPFCVRVSVRRMFTRVP